MQKQPVSIILASRSLRRKELMKEAGYQFSVIVPDIDESKFQTPGITAKELVKKLAIEKAKHVAATHPGSLVIGSDTVVDVNGEIIGKPRDAEHAEHITRKLFSTPHSVLTGLALVYDGIEMADFDSTTVYPKKMSPQQIANHIKGGSWKDKAGAYAIQETGDEFVEKIEGSLTNVMGLPMGLLQRMMAKMYRSF